MDINNWSLRHRQFAAALDADQVEVVAMLDGSSSIETGIQDDRTIGMVDDALIEKGNSWSERQMLLENLSGAISEELERRARIMTSAYPFTIENGGLKYTPSKTGVYEFCLAVARNPKGIAPKIPKASAIFEFISRDILTVHFGKGTFGFRTGAPIYAFEKRGVGTKSTFETLHQKCGEFLWSPAPGFPPEPTHKDLKDAGLDVVVWKPWQDGRHGLFFVLGQCACGKNDINVNKGRELSLKRLSNWLRPVSHATPLRCFLAAHHIPNSIALYELSGEAGIVFDRARITLIAESAAEIFNKMAEEIEYHSVAKIYADMPVA